MSNLGTPPPRDLDQATPGQITGTPPKVLKRLGIRVLRTVGVRSQRRKR